ncbi:MAG: hypothetical protein ABUL44_01025, partial [Flavobacterium sp.]
MRNQIYLVIAFFSLGVIYSQDKKEEADIYLSRDHIPGRSSREIPKKKSELLDVFKYYNDDIREFRIDYDNENIVFNNRMMNAFFTNEINSLATSMKDLSLDTNFS